jgi:hypothetical protein
MDWWKPIAALSVGLLTFVAVGGFVGLVEIALGSLAALAVVGLLVSVVLVWSKAGTGPNRWLSNPYWGR